MVRAVLLGVLATALGAGGFACGKNDATPAAQPGAVAGKVLEVSGVVSVAGKPLAVGDAVKTDDAVETGADGNVVIELAHNQARWELGPNHKVKPSESLAWTAAKKTGSAAQVDQATSAAGRPAERSAADTEATTRAAGAADVKADRDQPSTGAPPPSATASAAAPPPPPPAQPSKIATPRSELPALPTPSLQSDEGAPGAGGDKASKGLVSHGATPNPTAQLRALSSCMPAGSSVHIKAHIASHVPTISFVGDVDAAVQTCIRAAARKLTISIDSGDLDVTLTR